MGHFVLPSNLLSIRNIMSRYCYLGKGAVSGQAILGGSRQHMYNH